MDMAEFFKQIDAQIIELAKKEARLHATKGERRQQQVPVAQERRSGQDRRAKGKR